MNILLSIAIYLGLSLILGVGLLSVLQDLLDRSCHDEPVFQDSHAPQDLETDHNRDTDQGLDPVRSQFAWQSQSHFPAPD
jgi:hypothetical protein